MIILQALSNLGNVLLGCFSIFTNLIFGINIPCDNYMLGLIALGIFFAISCFGIKTKRA